MKTHEATLKAKPSEVAPIEEGCKAGDMSSIPGCAAECRHKEWNMIFHVVGCEGDWRNYCMRTGCKKPELEATDVELDDEETPNLADSDDEEDVPDVPDIVLSRKQRARRERRKEVEKHRADAEAGMREELKRAEAELMERTAVIRRLTEELKMNTGAEMARITGTKDIAKEIAPMELRYPKGLNSVNRHQGWVHMPMAMLIDSGAADTILPSDWLPEHETLESEGSRLGAYYVAAGGQPIRNEGEKKLEMVTREGQVRRMTFQVAKTHKALGSVSKICANGNTVIFDDEGSYILNKATGERTMLRQENGVYLLDVRIAPPKWNPEQGIPRKAIESLASMTRGGESRECNGECGEDCRRGSEESGTPFGGPGR